MINITESDLRQVVRFVLEKNTCNDKRSLFENYDFLSDKILCEEILREVSLRHQLLPILMSIVPLIPGCDAEDIKTGNVKPEAVAVAKFINDKVPEKHKAAVISKIAQKNCTMKVNHIIRRIYNAKTGESSWGPSSVEWKEVCEEVPIADKIVDIATSSKTMEKSVEPSKEITGSPNVFQQKIIVPQIEKDIKNGSCKVIDGEVFYTPFCHTDVEEVDTVDLSDILMPGESPTVEDLNKKDADDLEDFLTTLERFIKSSNKSEQDSNDSRFDTKTPKAWENNRNLILRAINDNSRYEYDGLDINKIDKLHQDWVSTKSNQKDIDDYINGEAKDSFIDGLMKQDLDTKKTNANYEEYKKLGLKDY